MEHKLNADYHMHTYRSDGTQTIEDNIGVALERGLTALAITDHGPFHHKGARCTFDYQLANKYELKRLQKKYPQIKLLSGIETNLVSLRGDIDITKEQEEAFDIIVMGQHRTPHGLKFWDNFSWRFRNFFPSTKRRREKTTKAYLLAMQNHKIKILAHLNRYMKVNIKPIAELAAKKGILIELNGKGVNFTEQEVKDILDSGANFVINSDAHKKEYVGNPKIAFEFVDKYNIPKERIVNLEY